MSATSSPLAAVDSPPVASSSPHANLRVEGVEALVCMGTGLTVRGRVTLADESDCLRREMM